MKNYFFLPTSFILFLCVGLKAQTVTYYPSPCDGNTTLSYALQNNLALGRVTQQSSDYPNTNSAFSSVAVDGVIGTTTQYSRTASQYQPWWEVDLGASYIFEE